MSGVGGAQISGAVQGIFDDLKRAERDGVAYEEAVKTGRMNDQMAVELFIVQYSADMTGTHATGSK